MEVNLEGSLFSERLISNRLLSVADGNKFMVDFALLTRGRETISRIAQVHETISSFQGISPGPRNRVENAALPQQRKEESCKH
jgi:hypothetical protein